MLEMLKKKIYKHPAIILVMITIALALIFMLFLGLSGKSGKEGEIKIGEKISFNGVEIELKNIIQGETPSGSVVDAEFELKKGGDAKRIYLGSGSDNSSHLTASWKNVKITLLKIDYRTARIRVESSMLYNQLS